ncbi:hypothetical protein K1719_026276 [Acacia pycnantha]|nr:hypothetical protein K1719_026276 [Acacia pycnantha]
MEDYMEALTGGPWVILDVYLSVARWKPEFSPKQEKIVSVVAWVRFPDLPVPLFDKKFLLNLGNSIGKVGHSKGGCEAFHKKMNEGSMVVDETEANVSNGEGKENVSGRWKTVQRARRPRRQDMEIQKKQSGSRFSILQGDSGDVELVHSEAVEQGTRLKSVDTHMETERHGISYVHKENLRLGDGMGVLQANKDGDPVECQFEEGGVKLPDGASHFSKIKTPREQQGGGQVNEARCRRFNEWIEDCSLIDIEAQGPFFTWKGPKWEGLERVYKRLDRCLCSGSWHEKFEEAEISVLPRICSDHHPLLV